MASRAPWQDLIGLEIISTTHPNMDQRAASSKLELVSTTLDGQYILCC